MPYANKEDKAKQMRDYRKTQCEKDKERQEHYNAAYDLIEDNLMGESSAELLKRVIQEQVDSGKSLEDAEEFYKSNVSAIMWQEYLDSKGVEWAKGDTQPVTDSVPESKPECFGKQFHKDSEKCDCKLRDDCHKAWVAEMFKPKAQKDAERTKKMIDLLAESKAFVDGIQRKEHAELWAKIKAQNDAEEKEIDALVKKYMDRGIPEATARESAKWERKQIRNAEIARTRELLKREFGKEWDLMSDEEKMAARFKILKDNKKFLEGSK